MTRWWAVVSLSFLVGCTAAKSDEKKDKSAALEKVALTNQVVFDLAACGPRAVALDAVNDEVMTGVLITARPMFEECLVNPAHRGPAPVSRANVKLTLMGEEAVADVTGENLTDAGIACLKAALARVEVKPKVAPTAPATGLVTLTHDANSPRVVFGVNGASDVLGTLRLAQPSLCPCYESLGTTPPPHLVAQVALFPDKPREVSLTGADDAVGKCLLEKLNALELPAVATETRLPWELRLIHSYAPTQTEKAPPDLQFLQLDAIRSQRAADVAITIGSRSRASLAYDKVVADYKKKPTPLLIKSLRESCAKVLAADDAWIDAFKAMLAVEQRTHDLVNALMAKDAQWGEAEKAISQRLDGSTAQLGQLEAQRKSDEAACPKVKY